MPDICITEHTVLGQKHSTFYLAAGPQDGPLIIFAHGWPELSISWRHQLPFFAGMGFRAIAPDMRGYGRSTCHAALNDYSQELIVEDMLALLTSLGQESAIWVGHDLGSPVVWNLASHHPERCQAVASLCVPYATVERGLEQLISLVDRQVYPLDEFPAGQWEYMRFYEENFTNATASMDANPSNMVQMLFRGGSANSIGTPSATAMVRKNGGWFGGADEAPLVPRDTEMLNLQDLHAYASALTRNGFSGPNAWYMNHLTNAEYASRALNDGRLDLPVLLISARYDNTCETLTSSMAEPMRALCSDMSEAIVDGGHWLAQEQPFAVNHALARWLMTRVI
jgi:pimeloyl-ACP methyl ester carboxylesterase